MLCIEWIRPVMTLMSWEVRPEQFTRRPARTHGAMLRIGLNLARVRALKPRHIPMYYVDNKLMRLRTGVAFFLAVTLLNCERITVC
jgi:hypothetical protein